MGEPTLSDEQLEQLWHQAQKDYRNKHTALHAEYGRAVIAADRQARQAPEGDRDAEARRLLHKVLTIGLNEGDPGVGFTPSKSEKRAGELSQEIAAFLRTTPAAPDALDARRLDWLIDWLGFNEDPPPCRDWIDNQDARAAIDEAMNDALASEPHKEPK